MKIAICFYGLHPDETWKSSEGNMGQSASQWAFRMHDKYSHVADNIEGSEVEIIDNCGHMILLEEASKALKILKGFIKKNHPVNN